MPQPQGAVKELRAPRGAQGQVPEERRRPPGHDGAGGYITFFDIGNRNLLSFFDFPGHDHPDFTETIGGVQHIALSTSADLCLSPRMTTRRS